MDVNLLGAGVECDNLETKCFSLPLIHWRLGWLKLVRNLLEGGLSGIRSGNGGVVRGILFMVCSWLSESQLPKDEKSPGLSYFWHHDLLSRIMQGSNHRPKSLKLWVQISVSFHKVFCQCPVLGVDLSLYWRNNTDYNLVDSVGESVSVFVFCYFKLKIPNASNVGHLIAYMKPLSTFHGHETEFHMQILITMLFITVSFLRYAPIVSEFLVLFSMYTQIFLNSERSKF